MTTSLTQGAVEAMHKGQQIRSPLLQVMEVKKIMGPTGQATERYRMGISDGVHIAQAMLATQLNELVTNNRLQNRCVVRLNEYICNTVQGRRIIIVLSLELTGPPQPQIGNPQNIEDGAGGGAAAPVATGGGPTARAPMQQQQQPQRQQQQSRPFQSNTAPRGGAALPEGMVPIKGLNPYQNRWTIKARVTAKTQLREFSNARGQGSLFSVDLLDAFGGEIRCTFFGEAATQWHDSVEVGQVLVLGRGTVKYANKNFSTVKCEYEISLDRNALIQLAEDDPAIPFNKFNFVDIADLKEHQKNDTIDLICVVLETGALEDIQTKAGNPLSKRVIKVGDASNAQVEVTLWGDQATKWGCHPAGTVILFKSIKVSDFNDRSLTVQRNTVLEVEPQNVSQVNPLREWYHTTGSRGNVPTMSNSEFRGRGRDGGGPGGDKRGNWDETRKTFAAIKDEALGLNSQGNTYFSVRATINEIKHSRERPPWYEACPAEGCSKKVTAVGGSYHCGSSHTSDHFTPRYLLNINANDHSGSSWLTCFNDTASTVLNDTSAETLLGLFSMDDQVAYEDVFQKALFKTYVLRVRAAESDYAGEGDKRVKLSVVKVIPVDYAKESKLLISNIAKFIAA